DMLSFLLFPVERPEFFDAVVLEGDGSVREIQVKQQRPASNWIWGAFKMPGRVLADLNGLWLARNCQDEYIGTLVNAYLAAGGSAVGVRAGRAYGDVGTGHGYLAARSLRPAAASEAQLACEAGGRAGARSCSSRPRRRE